MIACYVDSVFASWSPAYALSFLFDLILLALHIMHGANTVYEVLFFFC